VHAVIYLIFGFFGSAFLFYLFGSPFLAALMVIGLRRAIMILFLFIIMMLRVESPERACFRRGRSCRRFCSPPLCGHRRASAGQRPSAAAPLPRPDRAGRIRAIHFHEQLARR